MSWPDNHQHTAAVDLQAQDLYTTPPVTNMLWGGAPEAPTLPDELLAGNGCYFLHWYSHHKAVHVPISRSYCAHALNPEVSTVKISGGWGRERNKERKTKGKLMKRRGSTEAEGRVVKE